MIRLLTVDDHKMIHRAMAHMADRYPDVELIGEATNGEEALEFAEAMQPDVVLMDLNMPGIGGITATERLLQQNAYIKVIIISAHTHEPYPSRALAAGAHGFLSKDCDEQEIYKAIQRVRKGGRYIAAEIASEMASRLLDKDGHSPFDKLSEREMAVALKITGGHSTQQIADLLEISPNTVSSFRRRIYDKLAISNDVELTLEAFRHGLIGDILDS